MNIERQLAEFLARHLNAERGVLLGLSGGPDSLALLYLLIDYQKRHPLKLQLAHVDHGWRAESSSEVAQLQQLAQSLGLTLHVKRLSEADRQGNLEASGREARLRFFRELCSQHNMQAVLLGHQADDVAETTLKRLFEGVSLPYLNGFHSVTEIDSLILWRPLLGVAKCHLVDWLTSRGLHSFDDRTNRDPRFLRGRMRTQLLPTLSTYFGKEVSSGLVELAQEANQLRDYLDQRVMPYLSHLKVGPMGAFLDLAERAPDTAYELRHLVRKVAEAVELSVSREILDQVVEHLRIGASNKQAVMGGWRLIVDRGCLFITPIETVLPSMTLPLAEGRGLFGPWEITVTRCEALDVHPGWREAFQGRCSVLLPPGDYSLGAASSSATLRLADRDTTLARWWSNHKVPAFLRQQVPVIWQGDKVCAELLSGRDDAGIAGEGWFVELRFAGGQGKSERI